MYSYTRLTISLVLPLLQAEIVSSLSLAAEKVMYKPSISSS